MNGESCKLVAINLPRELNKTCWDINFNLEASVLQILNPNEKMMAGGVCEFRLEHSGTSFNVDTAHDFSPKALVGALVNNEQVDFIKFDKSLLLGTSKLKKFLVVDDSLRHFHSKIGIQRIPPKKKTKPICLASHSLTAPLSQLFNQTTIFIHAKCRRLWNRWLLSLE